MNDKYPIYYDAEFTGLHRNTTLISIGLVSESDTVFYAEFRDYDTTQVNDWIQDNVISNLELKHFDAIKNVNYVKNDLYNVVIKDTKRNIKYELYKWLENEHKHSGKQIQFFTDCYAYDWVLLNDMICLYGDAINIPEFINYIPIDLSTLLWANNIDPDINREKFSNLELFKLKEDLSNKLNSFINKPEECVDSAAYNMKNFGNNSKHNCLHDARIIKECFKVLEGYK